MICSAGSCSLQARQVAKAKNGREACQILPAGEAPVIEQQVRIKMLILHSSTVASTVDRHRYVTKPLLMEWTQKLPEYPDNLERVKGTFDGLADPDETSCNGSQHYATALVCDLQHTKEVPWHSVDLREAANNIQERIFVCLKSFPQPFLLV
jgi:hypothetical protein